MAVYELYFSPTGGTKKVMDILTDTWENERKLMDLSTAEPEGYTFQQGDLCFVEFLSLKDVYPSMWFPG